MSALQGQRVLAAVRFIDRDFRPMAAGAKIWQGALVMVFTTGASSGYYAQGQAAPGFAVGIATGRGGPPLQNGGVSSMISLGVSVEAGALVDNTTGANGALVCEVKYETAFWVHLFKNDTVAPVVGGDRENVCYVLDDQTVTHASAGNAVAGTVYDVTPEGVWVKIGGAVA